MITFKEILHNVFSSTGLNLDEVSTSLQSMVTGATQNIITSAANVYETYLHQAESYAVSGQILEIIDELMTNTELTLDQTKDMMTSFYDMMKPKDFVGQYTFDDFFTSLLRNGDRQVGSVGGQPIILHFEPETPPMAPERKYIYLSVKVGSASEYKPLGLIHSSGFETACPEGINLEVPRKVEGLIQSCYYSLGQITDELNDGADNAQCVLDSISATFANGSISKETLNSILDNYAGCSFASKAKDILAKYGSYDSTNILSMIAACIQGSTSDTYTEGDDYYTPNNNPSFISNFWTSVTKIIITAVAAILSAVFHKLIALIAIIWSVVSKLFSTVVDNIDKTSPRVDRFAILPTWNVYGGSVTNENVSAIPKFSELVRPFIRDMGSIYMSIGEMKPYGWWIAPSGPKDSFLVQQIFRGDKCNLFTKPNFRCTIRWDGSTSYVTGLRFNNYSYGSGLQVFPSNDFSNLTATDQQMKDSLWMSMAQVVYDVAPQQLSDAAEISFGYGDDTMLIGVSAGGLPSLNEVMTYFNKKNLSIPEKAAVMFMLYFVDETTTNQLRHAPDWDVMLTIINNDWFKQFSLYKCISTNGGELSLQSLLPGYECMHPSTIYPTLTKQTLLNTALSTMVAGAAIGITAITFRSYRKKKAVSRLALREAQFEKVKATYQANPTKENSKALNKANKKLTKAWNKAGKAGLTSYNGFGTGAETEGVASDTSSKVDQFLSLTNAGTSSDITDVCVDNTIDLKKLITG